MSGCGCLPALSGPAWQGGARVRGSTQTGSRVSDLGREARGQGPENHVTGEARDLIMLGPGPTHRTAGRAKIMAGHARAKGAEGGIWNVELGYPMIRAQCRSPRMH